MSTWADSACIREVKANNGNQKEDYSAHNFVIRLSFSTTLITTV